MENDATLGFEELYNFLRTTREKFIKKSRKKKKKPFKKKKIKKKINKKN
jgi:hypothetical protein